MKERQQIRESLLYPGSGLTAFLAAAATVPLGILLNAGFNYVNNRFGLPLFLDSVFTAVVTAGVGLAPGPLVGIGSNALHEVLQGYPGTHLPFALAQVATALIVWGFVRRGRFDTVGLALVAAITVAIANAVIGSIVSVALFGGLTDVGVDYLVTLLVASGTSLASASFWARLPANLVDKTIAILAAFFLAPPMHAWFRERGSGSPQGSQAGYSRSALCAALPTLT